MLKTLSVGIFAALVWAVQPAAAQAPATADDVKKLEAEVAKLRDQLQAAEARLKEAKAATDKKGDKKPMLPFGPGGNFDAEQLKKLRERLGGKDGPLGNLDPDQIKKMVEQAQKMREQFGGKGGGFGRFDPEQLKKMREQFGRRQEKKPEQKEVSPDIEKKLDRLLKEVEELRKEIRKK